MGRTFVLFGLLCALSAALSGEGSKELGDEVGLANLRDGTAAFESGDAQKAIEMFAAAATSQEQAIAASGYYNHGTALAMIAEDSQNQEELPAMLESAYQSLKRAYSLKGLSDRDRGRTQRNMQIVRERLSQLQKESEQDKEGDPDESEEEQPGEQQNSQSEDGQTEAEKDKTAEENRTQGDEKDGEMEEQKMNEILDQEADNQESREILEITGGIIDVDRDW